MQSSRSRRLPGVLPFFRAARTLAFPSGGSKLLACAGQSKDVIAERHGAVSYTDRRIAALRLQVTVIGTRVA